MIVVPDTIIKFYHNIPLDNTYENTVLFTDINAQNDYFHNSNANLLFTAPANSYQRVERSSLKVEVSASVLQGCNYMAFRNQSFGEKWFYAFVTSVDYINNAVTQVTFEIDVMQTYMFNYTVRECFVEREHVVDDSVGANLLSEPVEIGELTASSIKQSPHFSTQVLLMGHAFYEEGSTQTGGMFNNMPTGLNYGTFPMSPTGVGALKEFLQAVNTADKQSSVVSMHVVPEAFLSSPQSVVTLTDSVGKPSSLHGYVPRNKKLLTYPYNALVVNAGAESKIFKFEQFVGTPTFKLSGCFNGNPEVSIIPTGYQVNPDAGSGIAAIGGNTTQELVLSNFPVIGWNYDTFKSWLAQKGPSMALGSWLGVAGSVAGVGGALVASNPIGGLALASAGAGAVVKNFVDYTTQANTQGTEVRGRNSGGVDSATGDYSVYYSTMQMRPQYARIADDFLDRYGYTCKELKIPNRNSRPHWNYVKTRGFNCVGDIPQKYLRRICSIYDSGITFWKYPSEVGNYSLNNH